MDALDPPSKRQKTRDSSPDLPDTYSASYETIPTQPLPPKILLNQSDYGLTQPTQIIDRYHADKSPSPTPIVQVAASSPTTTPIKRSGTFANAMAPAGTAFRVPAGVKKAPPQAHRPLIELSSDDDGPRYRGGSSDSDVSQLKRSDIKTANFVRRGQVGEHVEKVKESPKAMPGSSAFQEITANSFYKPTTTKGPKGSSLSGSVYDPRNRGSDGTSSSLITGSSTVKRSSDTLANAYGGTNRIPKSRQTGPSRALPVLSPIPLPHQPQMSLDDIEDYQIREMVRKMNVIFPRHTVKTCYDTLMENGGKYDAALEYIRTMNPQPARPKFSIEDIEDYQTRQKVKAMAAFLPAYSTKACYDALLEKKGHYDDATDYLMSINETQQSLPKNHVDLTGSEDELMMTPAAPRATQQARAPVRKIQDKWGQQFPKKPLPQEPAPAPAPAPTSRGRLVRGRNKKLESSPIAEPEPEPRRIPKAVDSSDSDEAGSGHQSSSDDGTFEGRLLSFFNNCSPEDLSDTAGIALEMATYLVSRKPFKTLDAVRQVPPQNVKPTKSKRKPQPIGDRIVDKCDEMLTSYEAVDTLVRKCEAIGKPLTKEMKSWGFDIFGAREGELDIVSLKNSQPPNHDSGIGTPISEQEEDLIDAQKKTSKSFISQPGIMGEGVQMKDYQIVGVNWLTMLFKKELSCILADDMGLGKTCQVIAFIAHLLENGETGPHLVVVPSSTLENWLAEFRKFCPSLHVEPLYGSQAERFLIRDKIEQNREYINVVITTYTLARSKEDVHWLKDFKFCCTIFDEGHYLKNGDSQLYKKLIRIRSRFRLLLTGTPLQNNLRELISLLGFLLPAIFREKEDELKAIFTHKVKAINDNHEALLSAQRIARARSMLTPFILRRKKHQVLKDLPPKTRLVQYCEMTAAQREIYSTHQEKARQIMERRAAGEKMGNECANVLIRLRQAAIHPFMFRRIYSDEMLRDIAKACIKDPQWENSNPDVILQELLAYSDMEVYQLCSKSSALRRFLLKDDEWMTSGKVEKLCELLSKFEEEGHRVLIFSQFIMVMDILELVLQTLNMQCFRLDGTTKVEERQDLINEFNTDEDAPPIFMLSTKAGGAGINLARANKVIIFDSGFNPQDDIQAENRAHRIGQEKEVEVIRLISKDTVEEQIYAMGLTKLALDDKVAGEEEDQKASEKKEAEGLRMVEDMFFETLKTNSAEVENGGVKLPERVKKEGEVA